MKLRSFTEILEDIHSKKRAALIDQAKERKKWVNNIAKGAADLILAEYSNDYKVTTEVKDEAN